jgi:predicted HTH domain antitoxin
MNSHTISVKFPDDILLTLNESEKELEQQLRISLALRYYNQQKITIGKAAQIAGLSKLQFETLLSENEIPISNLTYDDIAGDVEKIK